MRIQSGTEIFEVGFDIFVRKRIRLWGINAPETRSSDKDEVKRGKKTLQRLAAILASANGEFELITHGDGKFGRCLGEIFIKELPESVNQTLINEGFAEKYEK